MAPHRNAAADTAVALPIATTAKVVGAMQHAARAEAATDDGCYELPLPCWQGRLVWDRHRRVGGGGR